jgi:hypothetical protein
MGVLGVPKMAEELVLTEDPDDLPAVDSDDSSGGGWLICPVRCAC